MTLYTVLRPTGSIEERGLTIEQAAVTVLTYDGHDYEIRPDGNGYRLWISWNGRMVPSRLWSLEADHDAAAAEIWLKVISAAADWGCDVVTDEEYAAMLADAAGKLVPAEA